MARMSIDDMVGRDPRITVLAKLIGWSRRETLGCLVGDVWPITYDQRTHLVSERVIDAAAGHDGFAAAMIEAELATRDRSGKVRVGGARERVEYLNHKARSGREGGLKSAESRRNKSKQTSSSGGSTPQAAGNPPAPDPSPASVPDPVSVLSPAPEPPAKQTWAAERHPDAGGIANAVWQYAAKAQGELQLANVYTPSWPLMASGQHPGWRALLDRVCELLVESTPEKARATAINRVAVAVAVARRNGDGSYFTPLGMFTANSFATWSALDPADITRKGPKNRQADLERELADRPGPQPI